MCVCIHMYVCVCLKAAAPPYSCLDLTHTYSALHETIYALEVMGGVIGGEGDRPLTPGLVCECIEEEVLGKKEPLSV